MLSGKDAATQVEPEGELEKRAMFFKLSCANILKSSSAVVMVQVALDLVVGAFLEAQVLRVSVA